MAHEAERDEPPEGLSYGLRMHCKAQRRCHQVQHQPPSASTGCQPATSLSRPFPPRRRPTRLSHTLRCSVPSRPVPGPTRTQFSLDSLDCTVHYIVQYSSQVWCVVDTLWSSTRYILDILHVYTVCSMYSTAGYRAQRTVFKYYS